MNSFNRSGSLREEDDRFDELVLLNKNQVAGPPVLDGSQIGFPSPVLGLRHSPAMFPGSCPGLEEVTEPGLLSFLTGDIGTLPEQMSMPSFLAENFQQNRQLKQSPSKEPTPQEENTLPTTGTFISSTEGQNSKESASNAQVKGVDKDRGIVPSVGAEEPDTDSVNMGVDKELFDQVSDSMGVAQTFAPDENPLGQIGIPSANIRGDRKKQNPPRDPMKINTKGKGVQKPSEVSTGNVSAVARSSAACGSLSTSAKEESGAEQMKSDDKENVGSQQATRLRYSKGAAPSKYCHVCGRSAKTVSVALCGNNKLGLCRKVVCDKCLIMHQWGDFRNAKEAESSWTCTHCRGDCPPRARCHQYQRNNMRRRLKSSSNHANAGGSGPAGVGGPRVGVSRSGVPLSGAAAISAAQHSARMSMRTFGNLGPLPGTKAGRISSGASGGSGGGVAGGANGGSAPSGPPTSGAVDGKGSSASDDLSPTNIIGAAGGVSQNQSSGQSGLANSQLAWLQGTAPSSGNFEGGNMYPGFHFLD